MKRKASAAAAAVTTSEAPNDASAVAVVVGAVGGASDGADLGFGVDGGMEVQTFEGIEGTPLPRNQEEEEAHVEGEGEEDDDDGAEGEEEEEAEAEEEVVVAGGQGVPHMGEIFFEVEAIRRKRVRKGKPQYFIKWIGWPETENTWEPPENLESVSDVIEAYEESLRSSGKHRKRKRKHVAHNTQPKKRLERSTTPYSLRRFSTRTAENHTQSAPPLSDPSVPVIPAIPHTVLFSDDVGNHADSSSVGKATPTNANNSANGSALNIEQNEDNDYDPVLSELKAMSANGNDTERLAIRIPEAKGSGPSVSNGQTDAKSKEVCTETSESGRCRGSKRRKCGSVKRFNKELYASEPANIENPVGMSVGTAELTQTRIAGNGGNTNHARPASSIARIIKPVGYSASVASGTQDVLVTFVASKSDGTEVMVDNKYLKAFNPLLLINFYEQHLRYSPTS